MRTKARYTDEQTAELCHAANCGLQSIHGHPCPSQSWINESDETKAAVLNGVRLARQGKTPRELHTAWCEFKTAQGWKYGPERDWAARTHPNLVAYSDLPEHERDKDELFQLICVWATTKLS